MGGVNAIKGPAVSESPVKKAGINKKTCFATEASYIKRILSTPSVVEISGIEPLTS